MPKAAKGVAFDKSERCCFQIKSPRRTADVPLWGDGGWPALTLATFEQHAPGTCCQTAMVGPQATSHSSEDPRHLPSSVSQKERLGFQKTHHEPGPQNGPW